MGILVNAYDISARLRVGVKHLESLVKMSKPGQNVTQEEYDLMKSLLKSAKDMKRLRTGAFAMANLVALAIIVALNIKYGHHSELGTKIQPYTKMIGVTGLGAGSLCFAKMIQKLDETKEKLDKLKEINLARKYR